MFRSEFLVSFVSGRPSVKISDRHYSEVVKDFVLICNLEVLEVEHNIYYVGQGMPFESEEFMPPKQ